MDSEDKILWFRGLFWSHDCATWPACFEYFVYSFLPSIFAVEKKLVYLDDDAKIAYNATPILFYSKTLKFHWQLNVSEIPLLYIVFCVYLLPSNQVGAMSAKALHWADDLNNFGQA